MRIDSVDVKFTVKIICCVTPEFTATGWINTTAAAARLSGKLDSMGFSSYFDVLFGGVGQRRKERIAEAIATALDRASDCFKKGDLTGARKFCDDVLSKDPRNISALHILGTVCAQERRYADALRHLLKAAELQPDSDAICIDIGNTYRLQGDLAAARENYRKAIELAPQSPAAHYNLANLLIGAGERAQAIEHLLTAHKAAPEAGNILYDLIVALLENERSLEARAIAMQAVHVSPSSPEARRALGVVFQYLYDPQSALDQLQAGLRLMPNDPEMLADSGSALQDLMRLDEAIAAYDSALAVSPDLVRAKWHRALVKLMKGEYREGWIDYELRNLSQDRPQRRFPFARWEGEPLEGKAILIYAEQGLGDEVMFASCLPEVLAAAGRCIIDCHPTLERLFRRSFPAAVVHGGLQTEDLSWVSRYPSPDYQIGIGSLPQLLRPSRAAFPEHTGYLRADTELVEKWKSKLRTLGSEFKVGLSWKGGSRISRGALRSIELAQLLPILAVEGVRFVSLQYSASQNELSDLERHHNSRIVHWQDALDDYDETAALVCALDLVISIDTSIVHLAGALGRTTWVMVPYSPEWRYGFSGDTMPWYPSVRIWRQQRMGEWPSVITRVADELKHVVGKA